MARPTRDLTPAEAAEVETLTAVLTAARIADYFGIGRSTFFAIMERDPEVSGRYKKGRAKAIGAIAQSLITKARAGDTASMIFFLKTQAGWRETTAIEHSGVAAAVDPATDGKDRLLQLLDDIALRKRQVTDKDCLDLQPVPAIGARP